MNMKTLILMKHSFEKVTTIIEDINLNLLLPSYIICSILSSLPLQEVRNQFIGNYIGCFYVSRISKSTLTVAKVKLTQML